MFTLSRLPHKYSFKKFDRDCYHFNYTVYGELEIIQSVIVCTFLSFVYFSFRQCQGWSITSLTGSNWPSWAARAKARISVWRTPWANYLLTITSTFISMEIDLFPYHSFILWFQQTDHSLLFIIWHRLSSVIDFLVYFK